ncbi:hypothetical protein V8C26DRAFT_416904 [Trichoderma gracile]
MRRGYMLAVSLLITGYRTVASRGATHAATMLISGVHVQYEPRETRASDRETNSCAVVTRFWRPGQGLPALRRAFCKPTGHMGSKENRTCCWIEHFLFLFLGLMARETDRILNYIPTCR